MVDMARLQDILDRFEVSIAQANDLAQLQDYEIVLILDDSGSMKLSSLPPHMRKLGVPSPNRWEELQQTVQMLVELGTCFDADGVDLFFLNRQPVASVTGPNDPKFIQAFGNAPSGTTPLTETLNKVVQQCAGEKPVLLFILTDGEPNGGCNVFTEALAKVVRKQSTPRSFKVQIMACTGNDDEIAWLNDVDKQFTEVDVTDDYLSEKQEIQAKNPGYNFTKGDWIMKAMLGPIDKKFGDLDTRAGTLQALKSQQQGQQGHQGYQAQQPVPQHYTTPTPAPAPHVPPPHHQQQPLVSAPVQAGKLTVSVLAAMDLPNTDSFGKSDPYVRVAMGGQILFNTHSVSNNLNPTWSYSKVINWDGFNDLIFSVFDKDLITKDDWMGQFVLTKDQIARGGVNNTFPLQVKDVHKKGGLSAATITIKVEAGGTDSCCAGCSVM
jgi:hypothetical protein